MMPSYYDLLELADSISNKIQNSVMLTKSRSFVKRCSALNRVSNTKKALGPHSQKMLDTAIDSYDNIVGRFDTRGKVASRYLRAPQSSEEEAWLVSQGVVRHGNGDWVVPKDLPLEPFENWFGDVPVDLRDKTPRFVKTRNGRATVSYVEVADRAKGEDSTATSLLYASFPFVAALAFFAGSVSPDLGLVVSLLFLPFTIALIQAEGPAEGARGLLLLGLLPLAMALASIGGIGEAGVLGALTALIGGGSGIGLVVSGISLLVMVFSMSLILHHFDKNKQASVIGGTFFKFLSILGWSVLYLAAFAASRFLPEFLQPALFFWIAGMYPMHYTNANKMRRAKLLYQQSLEFNIDRMGALRSKHIEAKNLQAVRAYEDKTPLYKIGQATGWMTKKLYDFAPDEGVEMVISALDATKHILVFGETGIGKSTVMARPMAKQWWESKRGGLLVLDGKGALPGDLSGIIQVMIKPGVNFAPLQGLDGHGISTAINTVGMAAANGKDAFWANGASTFIVHACQLFEALNRHELNYRAFARSKVALLESDMDLAAIDIEIAGRSGADCTTDSIKLEDAKRSYEAWLSITEAPRKWTWTVNTLIKVFNMINSPVRNHKGEWLPSQLLKDSLAFLGHDRPPSYGDAPIYEELGTGGTFDGAITYIIDTWTPTEPQQRSSYWGNVVQRIMPIAEGKYLVGEDGVHWKNLEVGVDAKSCLYGGSVGVELPKEMHQGAGLLITSLVNQLINSNIALRGPNPNWRDEGQKPLLKIVDECQDLVSDVDLDLLPKARSLEMTGLYLTQGFESLEAKFGDHMKSVQFANTFQNLVCLRSSPETYKYMAARLGVADLMTFEQRVSGMDMDAGVRALAANPISDESHPLRPMFRKLERRGAARLSVKKMRGTSGRHGQRIIDLTEDEISDDIPVPRGGKISEQPLVKPSEFNTLLTTGHAIVLLNRAGERRVDICKMYQVGPGDLRKD